MQKVRKPAVAGMFYPAGKEDLAKQIEGFLNNGKTGPQPKMLIVPHAGYDYSGPVAGYGYKLLQDKKISTVIILASSHNFPVSGAIVDNNDTWETPLGSVGVDKKITDKLVSRGMKYDLGPFVPEHSLEVQIPFLQKTLPAGFKIVPILVGDMDSAQMQKFASSIAANISENTLVVVSSDMSHYPQYEDAEKADQKTIQSILTGEVDKFNAEISELEKENIPNALTFMCAKPAVDLALMLSKQLNIKDIKLIKYANSGDETGDKSRVVGYSAIGFFGGQNGNNDTQKSELIKQSEQKELLKIARDSVEGYVKNGKLPNFDIVGTQHPKLKQKFGAFVTLNNSGNLRGCIGLMESSMPLYQTISQMAVAAAVKDPRFNPVSQEELSKLKYEISVLSPMKRVKDANDIDIGVHGVEVKKGMNSGVFLPQVAEETGWSKEEFLNHLCQDKAGLPADCWKDSATEIYVFTAQVFSN